MYALLTTEHLSLLNCLIYIYIYIYIYIKLYIIYIYNCIQIIQSQHKPVDIQSGIYTKLYVLWLSCSIHLYWSVGTTETPNFDFEFSTIADWHEPPCDRLISSSSILGSSVNRKLGSVSQSTKGLNTDEIVA